MGILFAKLWSLFNNAEHKVVIVGLDNAGKTTILYQFLTDEAVHTSPTIGSNVEEVVWKNVRFVMWDLGGQDSLRASWSTYYCNTEKGSRHLIPSILLMIKLCGIVFVILVLDSTDRERLHITKEELWKLLNYEDLKKSAVLIYANKQDIKGCMKPAEISSQLNLTSIKKHRWRIQPCCALTGEGLFQGLDWVHAQLKNQK